MPEKNDHHKHSVKKEKIEPFLVSVPSGEADIDAALTSIYQDTDGTIPDMKQIDIKRDGSIWRAFLIFLGAGVFCALAAWAGFLYLPGKSGTTDNSVSFIIRGQQEVSLGVTTTYTLTYENSYDQAIKDVTLSVYYPEGFVFITSSVPASNPGRSEWSLASLDAGKSNQLTITGKYFGTTQEQKNWRLFLNYTPSNFNSELQKIITLSTTITDSPYSLELTGSDSVGVGNDAFYTFTITKKTDSRQPVQLAVVPSETFLITSSTPALKNGKVSIDWTNTTTPNTVKVIVKGKYKASGATSAAMRGSLYLPATGNQLFLLSNTELVSQLQKSNLEFGVTINGTANDFDAKPGDDLKMKVHLKNTSGEEIRNAAVELVFEAPSLKKTSALAWGSINDKHDGDIIGEQVTDAIRRGTITWNSKKIPALAKIKADGVVDFEFTLPLKDAQDFNYSGLKENGIKINSSIDYLDTKNVTKSADGSPIAINLISDLAFAGKDTVTTNGQGKEEHMVVWTLTNTFHPLKNLVANAEIFGDATFLAGETGKGKMEYDPRSKKITWTIGDVSPDDTEITGSFTLVMNSKNPTQNTLLSKVTVTAEDALTEKQLTVSGKEILLK